MAPSAARRSKRATVARPEPARRRDVYSDLLAEAGSSAQGEERPLKRPRLAGRAKASAQQSKETQESAVSSAASHHASPAPATPTHSEIGDHGMDDDEQSELEFEDVSLEQPVSSREQSEELEQDVAVAISTNARPAQTQRRKPATRIDKPTRVLAHKAHLVTLLGHCMVVNSRCNDRAVQKRMRRLVEPSVRSLLNPKEQDSQFQRNHSLMNGLQRAMDIFKGAFSVVGSGMRRAVWRDLEDCSAMISQEIAGAEFHSLRAASRSLSGSQDIGAQLFCALLRSVGVTARLVCSLQVLPLSTSQTKQTTPQKESTVAMTVTLNRGRLDHLQGHPDAAKTRHTTPARSQPRLAYPVFWTEVFDAAYQKWISVDAIVTHTLRRPTKIEPPASYTLNQMAYAIAFSADGAAKDVTRRYARSYNAKTRRIRLESCGPDETHWLRSLTRIFQPSSKPSDDASIEDAELSRREASEGLPSNIQDFAGHPVYALERHLKRHEVVHPRREVGKVNAGTAANPKMEQVFRRQDVHVCRSGDQWFRLGRTLRPGLQPLKLVPSRSRTTRDDSDSEAEDTPVPLGLYILAQTELYIPAPVSRGKVPRNGFGNIDVYVPSMVPPGASHVRHELAKHAASILNVDAADAVVGLKFANRKGVAVIDGVVIPSRYLDAVHAVIEGLEWEAILGQCHARSLLALRLWRKLLQGAKIRERVAAYSTGAEESETKRLPDLEPDFAHIQLDDPLHTAGQYDESELIDLINKAKAKPITRAPRRVVSDSSSSSEEGENEVSLNEARRGSLIATVGTLSRSTSDTTGLAVSHSAGLAGGFLADDELHAEDITDDIRTEYEYAPRTDDGPFAEDLAGDEEHLPKLGGGFIEDASTDDTELGGGFIADDEAATDAHMTTGLADKQHSPPPKDAGRSHRPSIEDNHLQQALFQSISDAQVDDCAKTEAASPAIPASQVGSSVGETLAVQPEDQGTDTERGSRLSHDPEDEDAEPDWMVSD